MQPVGRMDQFYIAQAKAHLEPFCNKQGNLKTLDPEHQAVLIHHLSKSIASTDEAVSMYAQDILETLREDLPQTTSIFEEKVQQLQESNLPDTPFDANQLEKIYADTAIQGLCDSFIKQLSIRSQVPCLRSLRWHLSSQSLSQESAKIARAVQRALAIDFSNPTLQLETLTEKSQKQLQTTYQKNILPMLLPELPLLFCQILDEYACSLIRTHQGDFTLPLANMQMVLKNLLAFRFGESDFSDFIQQNHSLIAEKYEELRWVITQVKGPLEQEMQEVMRALSAQRSPLFPQFDREKLTSLKDFYTYIDNLLKKGVHTNISQKNYALYRELIANAFHCLRYNAIFPARELPPEGTDSVPQKTEPPLSPTTRSSNPILIDDATNPLEEDLFEPRPPVSSNKGQPTLSEIERLLLEYQETFLLSPHSSPPDPKDLEHSFFVYLSQHWPEANVRSFQKYMAQSPKEGKTSRLLQLHEHLTRGLAQRTSSGPTPRTPQPPSGDKDRSPRQDRLHKTEELRALGPSLTSPPPEGAEEEPPTALSSPKTPSSEPPKPPIPIPRPPERPSDIGRPFGALTTWSFPTFSSKDSTD